MDQFTHDAVEYYNNLSVKPYVYPFQKDPDKQRVLPPIKSIAELNADMASFVIQAGAPRTRFFRDRYQPLEFVHFSDVHAVREEWDRIAEYMEEFSSSITFALHTGDYCGGSQTEFVDCYTAAHKPPQPMLNCVGNHDTVDLSGEKQPKKSAWEKLFCHTGDWGVTFMPCAHSMTYYRDFLESGVRLIVLDLYYDIEDQRAWLAETLRDADDLGLSVITAMHEPTADVTNGPEVTFETYANFADASPAPVVMPFEQVICEFIDDGGKYICNLAGHLHHDRFGFTDAGILNICVECATDWAGWSEGFRTRGTRVFDCFNVVSVDVSLGLIKLVRIGDNADNYLRVKRVLSYDYINRKVIFND